MDWTAWAPTYRALVEDFGFDPRADEAARDALDAMLRDRLPVDLDALRAALAGREAWIVGPAAAPPALRRVPAEAPVLVADSAAQVALPVVRPLAIVTDLDGHVGVQVAANAAGVPLFVHAHGDNLPALRAHVPRLAGPVAGTTQAEPRGLVRNWGGFTDGDRACCLAAALGASRLALVGFDYDAPAPKSGQDVARKRRKLAWARRIVEDLGVPVRYA